ncbi:hypothetical protein CSQ90_00675 [Janthinobacterium sp. BJB303]|nr:hypothetical protein CSQ90_00675 [Janthinobacterium sp. BJB303]
MSETLDGMSLDIRKALRVEKAGYLSEVTKALVAVNSGGAIAMLTVMGALVKEPALLHSFKLYGFFAFVSFALGIVAALFVPIALVEHVGAVRRQRGTSSDWFTISAAILGTSFAGVIMGLIVVAVGVFYAF